MLCYAFTSHLRGQSRITFPDTPRCHSRIQSWLLQQLNSSTARTKMSPPANVRFAKVVLFSHRFSHLFGLEPSLFPLLSTILYYLSASGRLQHTYIECHSGIIAQSGRLTDHPRNPMAGSCASKQIDFEIAIDQIRHGELT
ncbi:uncharacterized protein K489DRAFT_159111 [Dissoconium aciculare CBS 342.82]|uniref:Uncharacterized protein n=1 Tax=Dissoconium aciculare CBS 342.82 TaxID=1314786 RepID=A0A6J3MBU0_9PEZI|nr:uncharacterized protein K489DRAFT_159111 [Dissoconium aciculare CBS 342.82]KAF1825491.1 hypothetical protein K489DRAFT_159111 [Dissoconium aciculare CBS 342.82]